MLPLTITSLLVTLMFAMGGLQLELGHSEVIVWTNLTN